MSTKPLSKALLKLLAISLSLILVFVPLAGCDAARTGLTSAKHGETEGLTIIATLFPHYDFARAIVGDKANVKLLLPPGVDSHSYEPTPADIIAIDQSDLFLYTGADMEAWADRMLAGLRNERVHVLALTDGIPLIEEDDVHDHDDDDEADNHDASDDHDDDHDDDQDDDHSSHAHLHAFDPHIWTSPVIAKKMVTSILDAIRELDPDNADYYTERAEAYLAELTQLDADIRDVVANAKTKTIYVGDRFAMRYFTEEYGLLSISAYDNCSTETEPSAADIAYMIDQIRDNQVPIIYYAELSDAKIARALSQETGAELLMLHSCHNVTKSEFDDGVTYLELMRQNLDHLKKGLN